jgi:DNA-binding transcriptional LysR family regulator
LLRSFVAIAEHGSISAAEEVIFLTQSALSLQMKRLEDHTEVPLLERHHRGVTLTASGRALLPYAQSLVHLHDEAIALLTGQQLDDPIRIGMIQDFADGLLSDVLIRFSQGQPNAKLQIRIGNSTELRALLAGGVVDIALALGAPEHSSAIVTLPVRWLGHESTLRLDGAFRLVLMEKPCLFRDFAIKALESQGIAYSVVMETPNLGVLCAAVNAGIGITCRSAAFLPNRLPVLNAVKAPLPQVSVTLSTPPAPSPHLNQLTKLLRSAIHSLDHAG